MFPALLLSYLFVLSCLGASALDHNFSKPEPYAQEWLKFEQIVLGGRFVLSGTVENIRGQFNALWQQLQATLPPSSDTIITHDVQVPNGPRVRVYQPRGNYTDLPIGLYIHSGGWVAGSLEDEDYLARDIAERVPMVVVSTNYRLAPENPFPAGLQDCIAAYKWMRDNASGYRGSSAKSILMGGSAGANLAAAIALTFASNEQLKPKGLIMASSFVVDPKALPAEYLDWWHPERYSDAAMLNRAAMVPCMEAYGAPPTEPLWSILLHPDLSKLPPTYLAACSKDPTHDEMLILNDRLEDLGVRVILEDYKGYPHFFWAVPTLKMSKEFMEKWADEARELAEQDEN